MKLSLEEYFLRLSINHDKKIKINISTFIDPHIMDNFIYPRNLNNSTKEFDFIYPASGEPYKNHNNLIDALIILAGENIYPSIVITLDEKKYSKLLARLYAEKEKHKLNLHNVGFIPHNKILELYEATSHLIYPSFNESLGLPLIEAAKLGMPVVAGELDYIRDTVKPENTFDPNSPISISRAIKRQLGIDIEVTKIIGADDFLSSIQAHHNF
jgi:glycosyltransferase involved in cell wall biosynthesis